MNLEIHESKPLNSNLESTNPPLKDSNLTNPMASLNRREYTNKRARAISIKGLYAKMAKLSYIRQINRGNELLLLKESKVRLKVILSG